MSKKRFLSLLFIFVAMSCVLGGGIFLLCCSPSLPDEPEQSQNGDNDNQENIEDEEFEYIYDSENECIYMKPKQEISAQASDHNFTVNLAFVYGYTSTNLVSWGSNVSNSQYYANITWYTDSGGYGNLNTGDNGGEQYYVVDGYSATYTGKGSSYSYGYGREYARYYTYNYSYSTTYKRYAKAVVSPSSHYSSASKQFLFYGWATSAQLNSASSSLISSGNYIYLYGSNLTASSSTAQSNCDGACRAIAVANFYCTYTHTFSDAYSTWTTSKSTTSGAASYTAPSSGPTRTGYTLSGWSRTSSANYAGSAGSITSLSLGQTVSNQDTNYDDTWEAVWTGNTYTVTLDTNGGTLSTTTKTVTFGSTYGTLSSPTKTGYSFGGWYTDENYTTRVYSSTTVSTASNHTLYAKWTPRTYTLSFYKGSSSDIVCDTTSKSVTYGAAVGDLPTPTYAGHTFLGWYTDRDWTTQITSSTIVDWTSTKTVYARWMTYEITYNANGGTIASSSDWTGSGSTVTAQLEYFYYYTMPVPTRSGYVFAGWYTSTSYTTRKTRNDSVSSAHTLYAKWVSTTLPWSGSGTSTSPYIIDSYSDLQYLEYAVNAGTTFSGKYFKQAADITCQSATWASIGMNIYYYSSTSPVFSGIYDGDRYEVTVNGFGLFGEVSGGTIQNLGVNASVTRTYGGLAQEVTNSTIQYCFVTGSVAADRAAGLVGYAESSTISECYNSATITSGGSFDAGGIAGRIEGVTIQNCYNLGDISGAYEGCGGIVGCTNSSATNSIINCYNYGTVTSPTGISLGGIMGATFSGSYTTTIKNCYNIGSVYAVTSSSSYTPGAIVGEGYKVTLTNCYYGGSCTLTYAIGDTDTSSTTTSSNTGATKSTTIASDAKSTSWSLYSNWDFSSVWTIISSLNNGYPIFQWQRVYVDLNFNANQGSGTVSSIEAYIGQTITLPTNSFTRAGFTANGWNDSTKLTSSPTYANGASFTVTGAKTFYANWTPISVNITVGFKFEDDITGNTYEAAVKSGFYYYVYYYSTTLSGNTTSSSSKYVSCSSSSSTTVAMRAAQTISFNTISPSSGWACVGYEVDGTKYFSSEKPQTLSVSISNSASTIYLLFKKVSDNRLEFQ